MVTRRNCDRFTAYNDFMTEDQSSAVDWDDWKNFPEPESMEGDLSDATPLCPRCLNEVTLWDHYCDRCGFAVGLFTPSIPFVNIPLLCEPFRIMWERLWWPHGETMYRRA